MPTSHQFPPLSPGKFRAVSRMLDKHGCFKMVAADQRAPMRGILTTALGHQPTFEDMKTMKQLLVEGLADHSTAMLMDPEYGLPGILGVMPAKPALIVALEDSNFEATPGGRKSHVIPNWSVEKIKRLGAEGVKYLVWYNERADAGVTQHQLDLIRHLGDECRRYDVAFLLEILVYPHEEDEATFARNRTEHVLKSVEAFADPAFGVDIYKLETPCDADGLATNELGCEALKSLFERMTGSLHSPWVMLSAAAEPNDFAAVLRCAYAAGCNGFLAGRSIWKSAADAYPDLTEVRKRLSEEGVPYLESLNQLTDKFGQHYEPKSVVPTATSVEHFPLAFPGF